MRLRYLSIPSLPPLKDISITFGHEPILGRECTIHFIVGVNGTGKSRLLRALTEIFLYLEQADVPPFPVTIAYDLGRNINSSAQEASQSISTIYYRYTGEHGKDSAYMAILDHIPLHEPVEWESFHHFDWKEAAPEKLRPYHRRACLYNSSQSDSYLKVKSYLPQLVLAYTSGSAEEWEQSFMPTRRTWEENIDATFPRIEQDPHERLLLERPANWNSLKEAAYQQQQGEDHPSLPSNTYAEKTQPEADTQQSIGLFMQPHLLKLVVCAVALSHVWNELKDEDTNDVAEARRERLMQQIDKAITHGTHMGGMRDILNAVDWLWPVTIGLRIAFQPDRFEPDETRLLEKLYLIATKVLRESEPSNSRMLFFDLLRNVQLPTYDEYDRKSTLKSLITILGGMSSQAFSIFKQLQRLQQQGILEDITIGLQKRKLNVDESGILLYDWLSDGERVFLGRMALFHLLKGFDDTLIILDEPETHFNDVWKREIVDIIDSGLRNDTSEIVLSTHSSISLTDVFDTEITLLKKDLTDGTVYSTHPSVHSFGASPDDILRDVFGAPESVGLRASEFLDLMLIVATNPEQTQRFWSLDRENNLTQQATHVLRQLKDFVLAQPNASIFARDNSQENSEFEEYLQETLRAVYDYTRQRRGRVDIINALDVLQERLGPGFYQFEFRRRLRALRKDSDAASH
ncbi:MAG: AAA family ATPase [Ktedonobacteraceae bacterium]|nr:AAA family ATPase [Ktedonobacteraceae bacterium]